TRLAILEVLANSGVMGISGSDLRKKLEISRQLLSYHMNELRTSNLVKKISISQRSRWIISDDGIESLSNSIEVSRIQAST
ncbi:MAG: ArsR/SmtB family transcription factor, partial [Candidatus Poseidoniales archaeon]